MTARYPRAGTRVAQPEVQAAVARFRQLPVVQRENNVLLYWLLGDGTPPYKMGQVDAEYGIPRVRGQRCGNCEFAFQHVGTGEYICSQIRDSIRPERWCRLWAPIVQ